MRNPDIVAKMSKTRRERVTSDPAYRAHMSQMMRQAWADGVFEGVRVGQCDWHDHVRPSGQVVKCQGTWELALARCLDEVGIDYQVHVGRIPYVDDAGTARSYYPDFYVPSHRVYVDVKNPLYEEKHARKLDLVREQNPEISLVVFGKTTMLELGLIKQ